jgi:hypothetical protein
VIRVQAVAPDTLGAALELTPGTELLAINDRDLEDFLDWEFLTADDHFTLHAKALSEQVEHDIERPKGCQWSRSSRIRAREPLRLLLQDGNPQGAAGAYIRDDDIVCPFCGNRDADELKSWTSTESSVPTRRVCRGTQPTHRAALAAGT